MKHRRNKNETPTKSPSISSDIVCLRYRSPTISLTEDHLQSALQFRGGGRRPYCKFEIAIEVAAMPVRRLAPQGPGAHFGEPRAAPQVLQRGVRLWGRC
jgi:hypothetical protein